MAGRQTWHDADHLNGRSFQLQLCCGVSAAGSKIFLKSRLTDAPIFDDPRSSIQAV
jgi:hypothetical protein